MILYPPVTKHRSNLIAKENMIDSKIIDKLQLFEILFLSEEKKPVKKNFNEMG